MLTKFGIAGVVLGITFLAIALEIQKKADQISTVPQYQTTDAKTSAVLLFMAGIFLIPVGIILVIIAFFIST